MKKAGGLVWIVVLAIVVCQSAYAAGISDSVLAAMFPGEG